MFHHWKDSFRSFYLAFALQACVIGSHSTWADVTARYELGPAEIDGKIVTLPLTLDLTADSGEQVVFFSIDVSASDGELTSDGTDFTRFEFGESVDVLAGWDQIPQTAFDLGELKSSVEFDTIINPLDPGRYLLGHLQVDLTEVAEASLPARVSIESFNSTIGVEVLGDPDSFNFVELSFQPGTISVPEPSSWLAIWAGLGSLGVLYRHSRSVASGHSGRCSLLAAHHGLASCLRQNARQRK